MSGSQGSSYSSSSGGCGYTVSKIIRLNYGDTVKFVVGTKPSGYTTSGDTVTVPGGNATRMYVNGTLVLCAGGGASTASGKATSGINRIVACGGDGEPAGSNGSYTVHWCANKDTIYQLGQPDECHTVGTHTHHKPDGVTCPSTMVTCHAGPAIANMGDAPQGILGKCTNGHVTTHGEGWTDCGETYRRWDCGKPNNTWAYNHSAADGDVRLVSEALPGTCLGATGSLTNTGDGSAVIQLANQYENVSGKNDGMQYSNTYVKCPKYSEYTCNLIIKDNVVCYFKRW